VLEILYEKYILISFSAREDGEKGSGNRQRNYFCAHLGGIPLLFLLLSLLLGKFFRGSSTDAHEPILGSTVSLYLLQTHRVGVFHT